MTPEQAQRRAQELAEHYENYDDLLFYLKCVHRLSEGKIQYILEVAKTKKNPMYYFKSAARREMNNGNTAI